MQTVWASRETYFRRNRLRRIVLDRQEPPLGSETLAVALRKGLDARPPGDYGQQAWIGRILVRQRPVGQGIVDPARADPQERIRPQARRRRARRGPRR